MKIISVVGARPNFMKIAPFINAIHEVNTAVSHRQLAEGDARVRPAGRMAEGVRFSNHRLRALAGADL